MVTKGIKKQKASQSKGKKSPKNQKKEVKEEDQKQQTTTTQKKEVEYKLKTWDDVIKSKVLSKSPSTQGGQQTVFHAEKFCDPAPQWNEGPHEDLGIYSTFEKAEFAILKSIDKNFYNDGEEPPKEVYKGTWEYMFENDGKEYEKSWQVLEKPIQ